MATSSIFANVRITDPKKAEMFVEALDASSRDSKRDSKTPSIPQLRDLNAIREMMSKRVQKKK